MFLINTLSWSPPTKFLVYSFKFRVHPPQIFILLQTLNSILQTSHSKLLPTLNLRPKLIHSLNVQILSYPYILSFKFIQINNPKKE
jgi:hypothetical protein